jgi:PEP-CTERM motif
LDIELHISPVRAQNNSVLPLEFPMNKSLLRYALFVAMPLVFSAPASLYATPIFTENFSTATIGLSVTKAGAFSAIDGTNVDVLGPGLFASLCRGPISGNCVDMGGSGGNALGNLELTTPLNLAPGIYDFSFDLIGSGRGQTTSTQVTFGDYTHTFDLTSDDLTTGVVVDQLVNVTGGPTQIQFLNLGGPGSANIGALLSNISVSPGVSPPPAVPEPGTLGLMAIGLLGAAFVIHKRFQT